MSRRFISIHKEGSALGSGQIRILMDTQTGAQYMFIQCGYAGGLTPLIDADGKPVVSAIPANTPYEDIVSVKPKHTCRIE